MIDNVIQNELEKLRKEMALKGIKNEIIESRIDELVDDIITKLGDDFLNNLKINANYSIRENSLQNIEFTSRLEFRWYQAFDLMEIMVGCCLEIIQEIDDSNIIKDKEKYLILKRFHARSIRITKEIIVLMRNGYADGAMARWRSLFEICVLALFIFENDNELAIMYQDYLGIENYNESIEYQKRCKALDFQMIPDDEMLCIINKKNNLEEKYSRRYSMPYGWACKIFPTKDITFNRILNSIKFEVWKPYYKMACNSVHAGPKSIFFNIGLSNLRDVLLVGPSNIGFTDPAQLSSISLLQITTLIITMNPTYENLIVINALNKLSIEIPIVFDNIQKKIDDEEKEET
jgi:hypothetical protein